MLRWFLCGSLIFLPAVPATGLAAAAADLRSDADRNGVASTAALDDELHEDSWNHDGGAVVVANIDDDQRRCPKVGARGARLSDVDLAACNDAADEVVNGPADEFDMAPLATVAVPDASDSAIGTVAVIDAEKHRARLFIRRGDALVPLAADGALTVAEMRSGAELRLEIRDVVRDAAHWNGLVHVRFDLTDGGLATYDFIEARVSPVMLQHDLLPAKRVLFASSRSRQPLGRAAEQLRRPRSAMITQPRAVLRPFPVIPRGEQAFQRELRLAMVAARKNGATALSPAVLGVRAGRDIWVQDYLELAYMEMPSPQGRHVIRVFLRSPNGSRAREESVERPMREAGRVAFTTFRGPDVAGLQVFTPTWLREAPHADTFNSTGNVEALPPHEANGVAYPLGRIIYGAASPDESPDPALTALLDAQFVQAPIRLDTSWLVVGHVDEFLHVVPSNTPRGWSLLVADPLRALMLLDQSPADGRVFVARRSWLGGSAERRVSSVRASRRVRRWNVHAAVRINDALRVLRREAGITDADIVRVPVLFSNPLNMGRLIAMTPNAANGLTLGSTYVAPRQHTVRDARGDLFERDIARSLAAIGVRTAFVEDWDFAHIGAGEIHCVTNALRDPLAASPWWSTGG